jgi:hypothetical protein
MHQQGEEPPFVGESPEEGVTEEPDLMAAIHRAAERASNAGYGGRTFQVAVEVDVLEHNQYVKTMRAIIDTGGSS